MKLIFASFGTQRKRRGRCNGDCWDCFRVFIVDPIGRIGIHTGISVAAVLLILAGQLDVHLKLSIVPWLE